MKHLILVAALLCLSYPVMAQEAAKAETQPEKPVLSDAEQKERLALAEQMHEIWPIRIRMENAIDKIVKAVQEDKQAEVKAAMRKSMQYDKLREESIKAMVETFTAEELKAMIAFYGSDTGRSISAKTPDYEAAITPALSSMMDKAMLDLRTGTEGPQSYPAAPAQKP